MVSNNNTNNMADLKQDIMDMSQEEVKYYKEEYHKSEKRIVLLGKTGVGKSSTGNTLLGEDIFHVNPFAESATKTCQSFTRERFGEYLRVIDVPGFSGTEFAEDEEKNAIMRCVIEACPGIHAILMVIRIGRFTAEDQQILARFIKYFGEDAREFVMVVFTGLDELQRHNLTIEECVSKATGDLKDFLKSIGNRYIAVSNLEKTEVVTVLLSKIRGLETMNNGRCYTNALLEAFIQELREEEDTMIQEIREGKLEIEIVLTAEELGLLEHDETARRDAALTEAKGELENERLKTHEALVTEKTHVKEADEDDVAEHKTKSEEGEAKELESKSLEAEELGLRDTEAITRQDAALIEAKEIQKNERLKTHEALVTEKTHVKEADEDDVAEYKTKFWKAKDLESKSLEAEELRLRETEAITRRDAALAEANEANENLENERLEIHQTLVNEKRYLNTQSVGSGVVEHIKAYKQWMKRKRSNLVKWISAVIDKVKNEKYDELSERNYSLRPLPRATVGYMYILK